MRTKPNASDELSDAPQSRIGRFPMVSFFCRDIGDRGRSPPQSLNMFTDSINQEMNDWLSSFPLLTMFGVPDERLSPFVTDDFRPLLNYAFWSARTHEIESIAMRNLSDAEIDSIFDNVAKIIDKDLRRFDPLVAYFGKLLPDGDEDRIESEREIAHCVKRDLAWAVIEKTIGVNGFFCSLLHWYDQGRWPHDWLGAFPEGHIVVA